MTLPLIVAATLAAAYPFPVQSGEKTEVIVGEVVDTTCFLIHEGRGEDHKACAKVCVLQGGSPAAILNEKTGRLIYGLAPMDMNMAHAHHTQRPDAKLLPFVGDRVKVTGHVYERAGVEAITLDKVESASGERAAK
jgi:hypothetical protein